MCATLVHVPTSDPRLLIAVRDPRQTAEPPILAAWVSCCPAGVEDETSTALVSLHGDLCAYSAARLREALLDYASYAGEVVLDLAALRFLDTSGVDLLEELSHHLLRTGGFLQLHDPSPAARRVLDLLGADLGSPCHGEAPSGASTVGR